ncbi:unnamed protein product, partial [Cyprideis torosa]
MQENKEPLSRTGEKKRGSEARPLELERKLDRDVAADEVENKNTETSTPTPESEVSETETLLADMIEDGGVNIHVEFKEELKDVISKGTSSSTTTTEEPEISLPKDMNSFMLLDDELQTFRESTPSTTSSSTTSTTTTTTPTPTPTVFRGGFTFSEPPKVDRSKEKEANPWSFLDHFSKEIDKDVDDEIQSFGSPLEISDDSFYTTSSEDNHPSSSAEDEAKVEEVQMEKETLWIRPFSSESGSDGASDDFGGWKLSEVERNDLSRQQDGRAQDGSAQSPEEEGDGHTVPAKVVEIQIPTRSRSSEETASGGTSNGGGSRIPSPFSSTSSGASDDETRETTMLPTLPAPTTDLEEPVRLIPTSTSVSTSS